MKAVVVFTGGGPVLFLMSFDRLDHPGFRAKLADRGSWQTIGVVTDVGLFLEQLAAELRRKGYSCRPMALGSNTDPYQPVERRMRITRGVLEVLAACEHPFGIVTKSALVLRDLEERYGTDASGVWLCSVRALLCCGPPSFAHRARRPAMQLRHLPQTM